MSYSAEISRSSPTCLLILIDQSTSMGHRIAGGQTKAAFLADVVNKTLYTMITNCSKADGVRDYFHVGVLAYSGTDSRNALGGPLGEKVLNAISKVAAHPIQIESRVKQAVGPHGDFVSQDIKFPVWLQPRSQGKTSMCAGLKASLALIRLWCTEHSMSYPPTVLHVTDGHPTDGDPEPIAAQLKTLGTENGACLLFNLHVDIGDGPAVVFPSDGRHLPDRYAATLFRMSSILPPHALRAASQRGYSVNTGARGFVFNAGIEAIVDFFDIGTRPAITADR